MTEEMNRFWQRTWSAWRSGALDKIGPSYGRSSAGNFEGFLKYNQYAKSSVAESFFLTHQTFDNEFLVVFSPTTDHPNLVMTNQRLWMYDKQREDYAFFKINDIDQVQVKSAWNSTGAIVQLKDGRQLTFETLLGVPTQTAVELIIEQSRSPLGWESDADRQSQYISRPTLPRGFLCPRCGCGAAEVGWNEFRELVVDGAMGGLFFGPFVNSSKRALFARYYCPNCGKLPFNEFPDPLRKKIWIWRIVWAAIAVFLILALALSK